MSAYSTEKKTAFLGMPLGTAASRLRKRVMFTMAQKLGEDVCFRCGRKIQTPEEFSLDHKEPWEGVGIELFWDLENIGFSHLDCNIKSQRRNLRPLKVPDGMAWCSGCRKLHAVVEFGKDSRRRDGLSGRCRVAQSRKNAKRPTTRAGRVRARIV